MDNVIAIAQRVKRGKKRNTCVEGRNRSEDRVKSMSTVISSMGYICGGDQLVAMTC